MSLLWGAVLVPELTYVGYEFGGPQDSDRPPGLTHHSAGLRLVTTPTLEETRGGHSRWAAGHLQKPRLEAVGMTTYLDETPNALEASLPDAMSGGYSATAFTSWVDEGMQMKSQSLQDEALTKKGHF